ncbi:MAG: hypothetical protein KDF60_19750, partial [Calditrichaeota bacterium]|nr:hypothetical protein [Calditrichota bacterium]
MKTNVFLFTLIFTALLIINCPAQKPISNVCINENLLDFKVNERAGKRFGEKSDVSIASDASGNSVISWTDSRNGDPDIYCQKINAAGDLEGQNILVNDDNKNIHQLSSEIAMLPSGEFIIAWVDYRNLNDSGYNFIYAQVFDQYLNKVGPNFKVNSDSTGTYCSAPSVTLTGKGQFIITWQDYNNGKNSLFAQIINSDGEPVGDNFVVKSSYSYGKPSISSNTANTFIISWIDTRVGPYSSPDVYAQLFSEDGSGTGSMFKVNSDVEGEYLMSTKLSMNASGEFAISYVA